MAAPVQNSDPFGNDALFDEFEKPTQTEDWDQEFRDEESRGKVTRVVNPETGAKHFTFEDSSDNEEMDDEEEASPEFASDKPPDVRKTPSSATANAHSNAGNSFAHDPSCCVQISFYNKKFAQQYKDDIQNFITELIAHDNDRNLHTDVTDDKPAEILNFFSHFMIDQQGSAAISEHSLEDQRPLYDQVYRKSLPCESESEEDEDACPQTRAGIGKKCWNCGGGHSMNECKEPKDHNMIAKNRAAFMAAKEMSNQSLTDSPKAGDGRYTADDDPRFANFKAGHISDSLREALGIQSDQLPPYIYNMRNHGYPPGHLLTAKLSAVDIAMFDKHGQEVSKDGQVMEDGEVDENAAKGGYDYNKIIEYPGFNIYPDASHLDCQNPPFNKFQLKSNLPVIFGKDVFRKIDGLQRDAKNSANITDREESDMDLTTDGSPTKPLKPSLSCDSDAPSPSASLSDLESAKAQILQSLETELTTDTADSETDNTDNKATDSEATDIEASNSLATPKFSRTKSVLIDMGTPIGVNSSQILPDSDKFRQNITEHIPYENLPNATGMFSKMMKVMGKVKDALSSIRK